jgi:cyanophycinase-like exopeptidase
MTDGRALQPVALAVDEATSVVVDRAGRAAVMGAGTAWVIWPSVAPERCEAGQPLTFRQLQISRLRHGASLTLPGQPGPATYLRSVVEGRFDADPY